ncbi:hypothetical protein PDG61_13190 [Mycolicibacterium sp. BiH015]|uniref:hypothetical protein n=1 Tax=Mycolicibacterium sp. BiH015 TaxID=3018808 RepID=UPI0022E5FDCA|nr:hypothetical protein [Mycolicibacterium sp. BiH015]MDA2891873.1 hypothetical protein [Mycolicibacterium sp. BiH015]
MNAPTRFLAAPMIACAVLAAGLGLTATAAATPTTNGSAAIATKPEPRSSHNLSKNTWRQRHHYGHWHRH